MKSILLYTKKGQFRKRITDRQQSILLSYNAVINRKIINKRVYQIKLTEEYGFLAKPLNLDAIVDFLNDQQIPFIVNDNTRK